MRRGPSRSRAGRRAAARARLEQGQAFGPMGVRWGSVTGKPNFGRPPAGGQKVLPCSNGHLRPCHRQALPARPAAPAGPTGVGSEGRQDRQGKQLKAPVWQVVLLGQDPYHDVGQAVGLSFSVPRGMKVPAPNHPAPSRTVPHRPAPPPSPSRTPPNHPAPSRTSPHLLAPARTVVHHPVSNSGALSVNATLRDELGGAFVRCGAGWGGGIGWVPQVPSSLQNMFKELESDLGHPRPKHGDLEKWAAQGVRSLRSDPIRSDRIGPNTIRSDSIRVDPAAHSAFYWFI